MKTNKKIWYSCFLGIELSFYSTELKINWANEGRRPIFVCLCLGARHNGNQAKVDLYKGRHQFQPWPNSWCQMQAILAHPTNSPDNKPILHLMLSPELTWYLPPLAPSSPNKKLCWHQTHQAPCSTWQAQAHQAAGGKWTCHQST